MQTITKAELLNKLLSIKGNTFVTASIDSTVKLKGGNPWGNKVKQHQNLNGAIGFQYINSVNRQEAKHGIAVITEQAKPRRWGTPSENGIVINHIKDGEQKHYLQMKVESRPDASNSYYYNTETGEKIEKEQIAEWKYQSNRSSTQANLPEDVEIIVRDIDFNNIKEIKLGGEHYKITE